MKKVVAVAVVALLTAPAEAAAHRLDEYLQAARVSLARDRLTLELDLTPGASIASSIVTLLDRDGDGSITPIEAREYGLAVLSSLVVELDGRAIALTLTRAEVPPLEEMHDGVGSIRLQAVGRVDISGAGRRLLYFKNNHRPEGSVYLVNALVPEDRRMAVLAQTRDPQQREIRIEYAVGPPWPIRALWLIVAAAVLATLIARRRSSPARSGRNRPTFAVVFPRKRGVRA